MNTKTDKKVKIMRFIGMILIAAIILTIPAFASVNYGERGGRAVLDNLFWVAVVAAIWIVGKFVVAGNLAKTIISFFSSCFVIYLIGAPESLKTVGNNVFSFIFGS